MTNMSDQFQGERNDNGGREKHELPDSNDSGFEDGFEYFPEWDEDVMRAWEAKTRTGRGEEMG
jgi:hypothetical protein